MSIIKTEHPERGLHYWRYESGEQTDSPEGFIKAWPIGGGFAKRIPKSHVTEWDTQLPEAYKLVRLSCGDDLYLPGVFRAYVNPFDSWNGWAKPLVDEQNLMLFIAEQDRLTAKDGPESCYVTGKLEGRTLVVDYHQGDSADDIARIEPQTITVNGQNVEVWDISLGLTWDVIENPRFVMVLPCSREEFPDLPELGDNGDCVIWDRQEKKPVATFHDAYSNLICLECKDDVGNWTAFESWLNQLSNESLESEGVPPTKEGYGE